MGERFEEDQIGLLGEGMPINNVDTLLLPLFFSHTGMERKGELKAQAFGMGDCET